MQITTTAVVLRSYKAEDDRILTILTRDFGVITAYANGAARPRSPLASTTELLCHSHFVLFKNRGRYVVDKADSENIYFGIRSRFEDLALGSYLAQLAAELCPHDEPSGDYINLLLGCLHYLEGQKRPHSLLKPLFELRLLTLAGYMPNLVACRECGSFEDDMLFSPANGELICASCYENEVGFSTISAGVLAAMRHIIYCESAKLFSFTLSPESLAQLERIAESYLKYHLEKTLPTLEFYRSLQLPAT